MKDKKYLERIINYIEKINKYMEPVNDAESFKLNQEKVDAVILNLEQIGETAKKISRRLKSNNLEIEWIKIIALRNLISHEYEGIDVNMIYETVTIELNELLLQLKKITI